MLRHGDALQRKRWDGDDRQRPLLPSGTAQAQALVPLLAAYDVTTLVSSSSLRCVDTLAAYAETTGYPLRLTAGLSEEDATKSSVDEIVEDLLDAGGSGVLCTHRPVLPTDLGGARRGEVPARAGGDAGRAPPQGRARPSSAIARTRVRSSAPPPPFM